jgi:hypothetical protein
MTFTEAAVQVLRLVGKPLHYKEITDVAIEKELLSHVGKSPEVTMGARLAAVVKKTGPDNPLTRVKPGVFALAEWDAQTIEQGLNDRTPALRKLAKLEAEQATLPGLDKEDSQRTDGDAEAAAVEVPRNLGEDEIARAELTAAATELFAAEDDDDEPLLGRDEEESESADDDSEGGRRRRRRRRRGRGGERDDDDLPSYTVSEASDDVLADVTQEARERPERGERPERERGERAERAPERDRERNQDRERGAERERGDRERNQERGAERERNQDRERGAERERGQDRERAERDAKARPAVPDETQDLPFLCEQALGNYRRQGGASLRQLADALVRKVRGAGDVTQLSQWLSAVVRTDNLRRQACGDRPRFRLGPNGRIGLWEWVLDRDQVRLEKEARVAIERYQEAGQQRLARRLLEMPARAFGEFAILLLEAQEFSQFRPIKRPVGNASDLCYAATQRTATGELPVALSIRRDGRDVGREQVVELRGSLHYYGSVSVGVIVTAGQVMSGAREEAQVPGATPIHFIDGTKLAKTCDHSGIGVVRHTLSITLPDVEMFEALRGT